jgi:predicted transcriptional regulator
LKVERNISFSKDTVKRCLDDLEKAGKVKRVKKPELDTGELVEAGEQSRAYYIAASAFDE